MENNPQRDALIFGGTGEDGYDDDRRPLSGINASQLGQVWGGLGILAQKEILRAHTCTQCRYSGEAHKRPHPLTARRRDSPAIGSLTLMFLFLFLSSSGQFLGDIAIPEGTYPKQSKTEAALQEEVERYKKEVLEGLQIEEEGLTDLVRKKTKQLPTLDEPSRRFNDPAEDADGSSPDARKNGQVLKNGFDRPPDPTATGLTASDSTRTEKPKRKHRKRHVNYLRKNRGRRRQSGRFPYRSLFGFRTNGSVSGSRTIRRSTNSSPTSILRRRSDLNFRRRSISSIGLTVG